MPLLARQQPSALIAAFVVVGLVGGLAACAAPPEPSAEPGTWTVLSFSIADTDLEPYMMDDVAEMGSVESNDALSIVALVDRAEGYSDDDVLGIENWVGGKLLKVSDSSAQVLDDLGDVNTGDPDVLAEFITRGIQDYPADNYALIISDHGASWPGVGGDESTDGDHLSLAELDEAIGSGLEGAGIDKLDLLGFDACLMATYEVASTLAPRAHRLLASQELEPGHGWDYTALQYVVDNGGATVDELGAALIDGFEAQAKDQETSAEITLSLIDLTAMDSVDAALATFTSELIDRASDVSPAVGRSLAQTLGFGTNPDPEQDSFMSDLAILAGEIGVDALDVSDAADALIRSINDAVLDKVDGQATQGATGLSIYFPPTAEYFDEDYNELGLDSGWSEFLAAYYGAGNDIPADNEAQFAEGDAEVFFDEDGLNITASFASAVENNLAEAFIRYGVVEADDSITFLGQEPAAIADDGSGQALGIYDLTMMTISDGEDITGAYLDLTANDDFSVVTIDVPMGYYAPGDDSGETYQDVLLCLVTDGETGDVLSETYYSYNDQLGTYGALSAEPNGIIIPEQLNVLEDGTEEWFGTSDYGLYADLPSLEYDFETLESGTLIYIELFVVDFGGNRDVVSATVEIP
jgi:hypothetical protein